MSRVRRARRSEESAARAEKIGLHLGAVLTAQANEVLIVALSPQIVPLAAALAARLGSEHELMHICRICLPGDIVPVGAVDEEGHTCITSPDCHAITPSFLSYALGQARAELSEQRGLCWTPYRPWTGRTLLLVDDQPAAGAAMLLAIRQARRKGAQKVIVLMPDSSREDTERVGLEADQVLALDAPVELGAPSTLPEEQTSPGTESHTQA
jgi:putative phosphoribosyl transferase